METPNFDYLLTVIESSRLSEKMKREVALLLLNETDKDIEILANHIKKSEDEFESIALSALSSHRLILKQSEDNRVLTYEQAIIKDAIQQK